VPLLADVAVWWPYAALVAVVLALVACGIALSRKPAHDPRLDRLLEAQEKLDRHLRLEMGDAHRALRGELDDNARALRDELSRNLENLRTRLAQDAAASRQEGAQSLQRFADGMGQQLGQLSEANERRLEAIRRTLQERLDGMQADNANKLDEMRRVVDEKLHETLEKRLGESFRLVSERLEAVHQGLGDMRQLAAGVGGLQRVLVNVKSRGTWGEVQLARLIEDTMTPDQYGRNVKPVPGSSEIVEFAIRLPGQREEGPVWLPIDAKFPREDFERLMDAHERADEDAIRVAGTAFERAVESEARRITTKYVSPPHTTDFAILFLPTEGLYAEVLRRQGLMDRLLTLRVNVAGPSNLAAMLNSLQMGFRTLAIERRSSEVWQVLRAVKTEFHKFGETLAGVKKALDSASNRLGQTETRTRVMLRNLRSVEALPEPETTALLGVEGADEPDGAAPDAGAVPPERQG